MPVPPPDTLAKIPLHQVVGLFRMGNDDPGPSVASFLRAGLARGEKCLLACGPPLADAALDGLRRGGIDVADALQRGSVVTAGLPDDAGEGRRSRALAILAESARMAVSERFTGLRAVLESGPHPGPPPSPDALSSLLDGLEGFVAGHPAVVLCVHEVARLPADALPVLLRAHPLLLRGNRLLENLYHVPGGAAGTPADAARVLADSLDRLALHADRIGRIRRQAFRLARFRDITLALMEHSRTTDLLRGIADAVISLGHRLCWIGMARPDGRVEPVAVAGDRAGYLREITVRWDDTPEGRGPVGTAIRTGEPQVIQDVARSRRFAPWRAAAVARSYQSVASFPIRTEGRVVGALAAYSSEPRAFDREAVEELSAFALQASLAMQRGRETRRLARSEERLRRVFEQIPAVCFTFDREGRLVDWNLHSRRLFAGAGDIAAGTPLFRFLATPEGVAKARELLGPLFEGKSFANLVWEVDTGQGVRRLLTTVYPYRGATDQVDLGIAVGVEQAGPHPEGEGPGNPKDR